MKQQTSIHVQPVKGGSEQHNKREKTRLHSYRTLPPSTSIGRKTHRRIDLKTSSRDTLKSTGQKMQSKATPIREAVVVIKSETTMEDLKSCPMHTASGSG